MGWPAEPGDDLSFADALRTRRLGEFTFEGRVEAGRGRRGFGGHLAAHSLHAAGQTVATARSAASIHVQFVSAALADDPVSYQVQQIRDGGSVSVRQVTAHQQGTVRALATCTFTTALRSAAHQPPMPRTTPPEGNLTVDHVVPGASGVPARFLELRALEAVTRTAGPPQQRFWIRPRDPLPDPLTAACALVYLSDLGISHAADRPHLEQPGERRGASLDHSVWFQSEAGALDCLASGWLLVDQDGRSYSGGRAFTSAEIYAAHGQLIATCAQQALIVRT